jgi:hypothetical protein
MAMAGFSGIKGMATPTIKPGDSRECDPVDFSLNPGGLEVK